MSRQASPKLHKMGKHQRTVLLMVAMHSPAFSMPYVDFLEKLGGTLADLPLPFLDAIYKGNERLTDDMVDNFPRLRWRNIDADRVQALGTWRPDVPWTDLFLGLPRNLEPRMSEAARQLERRRLIVRIRRARNSRQTSHLRITPTGVEAALELMLRDYREKRRD